jgi:hypothetical protein
MSRGCQSQCRKIGDGVAVVLPTKADSHGGSGAEVLITLTAESAPNLLEDPELLEFAEPIMYADRMRSSRMQQLESNKTCSQAFHVPITVSP